MIVDFSEVGPAVLEDRTFDVCIVGAGPAGITIATNLSRTLSVLLLEGGGLDVSEESQQIYQGTITGRDYYDLDAARIRCFGGTSNHWSGRCQALDDYDFRARPYVAHSGWPIEKADLHPYFARAAQILDTNLAEPPVPRYRAKIDLAFSTTGFVRPFNFLWSPPTRFSTKFLPWIAESTNITCLLHANLTDILLDESGTSVSEVEITGYEGVRATVPARRVIIAAGGIENARILLNCNKQVKVGIGNQHDLVGRFFTEHPEHRCGWLVLQDDVGDAVPESFTQDFDGRLRAANYSATREFTQKHEILNFVLTIYPKHHERRFSFKEKIRQAVCETDWFNKAFDFVFRDGKPPSHDGVFVIATEQAPNPESRITLNADRDRFGWRRVNLDWRMLPIDKQTIAVAVTQFATQFAIHDLGRARVREWILANDPVVAGFSKSDEAGYHHMSTTRMSDDPKRGVVDRDCRVHGISNLYMAGSSVFSTVGFVNPTFTIIQLSLRLASHLNSKLS